MMSFETLFTIFFTNPPKGLMYDAKFLLFWPCSTVTNLQAIASIDFKENIENLYILVDNILILAS